ncbi:unnamed protein product [Danaus chrysippus]|uniref:(African queen) hypothetical protein n=1 Tax=Danaus chrysippus TaxID=151541 RepID=A0A8J2QSM5_9NEOP|nr:unnamed protein product [Danaus chrysippus]
MNKPIFLKNHLYGKTNKTDLWKKHLSNNDERHDVRSRGDGRAVEEDECCGEPGGSPEELEMRTEQDTEHTREQRRIDDDGLQGYKERYIVEE